MLQLFLTLVLLVIPWPRVIAETKPQSRIFILKSSGICDGCAEALAKMLFTANIPSQILGPDQLKTHVSPQDMLIVGGGIPGGEGEWTIKQDLQKAGAFGWLKEFIFSGGRYLGICAGAYLTEEWIDQKNGETGLNLFPGKIDNFSKNDKARLLRIHWLDSALKRWVYFQDGPRMQPHPSARVSVIARFELDHSPAALIFEYGKGHVGLISPHLEADETWFQGDHLNPRDGLSYDLGIDFVKKLENRNSD